MKVISKQPLCCSIIPKTAAHIHTAHIHTYRHTYVVFFKHILTDTVEEATGSQAIQKCVTKTKQTTNQYLSTTVFLSSALVLLCRLSLPLFLSPSIPSCFFFFLSLRRLTGVLLMAVVINSYLLSVHISPSLPLSTLLSICLSPYHFLFTAISLSLSLTLSLSTLFLFLFALPLSIPLTLPPSLPSRFIVKGRKHKRGF